MTVLELKQMLEFAPDDLKVYVMAEFVFGSISFKEACSCDSGVVGYGDMVEDDEGASFEGFIILPHGMTQDDTENGINLSELN